MKFHYLSLVLFTSTIFASIHFDQEILEKMKKGASLFCVQCQAYEQDVNTKFPVCRIAENHSKKLEEIKNGELSSDSSYVASLFLADDFQKKIEKNTDYQEALKQAKIFDTDEAWRVVHNIVYRQTRELIEQESDLKFPSLRKEYMDMNQKLREFAQENKDIDPEKNGRYMEALSLLIHNVEFIRKNNTKN
jgi:anion-transporting  ArsA/GET3 family ATPase